jgi:transposase
MTDEQWAIIEPLLPASKSGTPKGGRPRKTDLREVLNAIFYITRTGCVWQYLPHDFPKWATVYDYHDAWTRNGTLAHIHDTLRASVRTSVGKKPSATAAIVDSQSIKSAKGSFEAIGYDGGKKVKGRKRHILVDTLGLIIGIVITSANTSDQAGAFELAQAAKAEATLQTVWADSAYQGEEVAERFLALSGAQLSIVRSPEPKPKGFQLQAHRWIVERTFGWLVQFRRLVRDHEYSCSSHASFIRFAMISIMSRRLTQKQESA